MVSRVPLRCLVVLAALSAAVTPSAAQDLTVMVPADDGTELATFVYFPQGDGPWPALLTRTPYGSASVQPLCQEYADLGYACAVQDMRGWGGSGGDPDLTLEGVDGRATVRWIADQGWCNGRVGTFGYSARGEAQYRLAPGAPDAFACMAPSAASPDAYHHLFFQGGALREELVLGWARATGAPDVFDEELAHRLLDAYWDPMQPIDHVDQVRVPGLHVGGWYDICSQGTLDAFSALQAEGGEGARGRQVLVMSPHTHEGTSGHLFYPANAILDSEAMEDAWFDHCLRGAPNTVERWPNVRVYLMGPAWSPFGIPADPAAPGNVWVGLDRWPPPSEPLHLYLAEDGSLAEAQPPSGELELLMDPSDAVPTSGGANLFCDGVGSIPPPRCGPRDQRPVEGRDDVLVFTTEVLSRPVTVMGRVTCRLWVRPDTPDLDLAVRLSDVYPTGHSMLVIDGIQRARMRCGDDHECFLTPGEPAEIVVDLWSTALVFNRGHRIRVSVSGSNWPRFEVNPNHGGDLDGDDPPVVARPWLLFGPDHPSNLELPLWTPPPRRPHGRLGR